MSRHRPPAPAVPNSGRRHQPSERKEENGAPGDGRESADRGEGPGARTGFRTGAFANTSADFDGSATNDLVCTIGLLLGSCGSERKLALLAQQLATHVERRDAHVVIDQLRWRLDVLDAYHRNVRDRWPRAGR